MMPQPANSRVTSSGRAESSFCGTQVSDRRNFRTIANASRLKQQAEEAYASGREFSSPSLQTEIDKLEWCDALIRSIAS